MEEYIRLLAEGKNLSFEQAKQAMLLIMSGQASDAQIGAYLMGMRMKGESIEEITASATVMREKCQKIRANGDLMDIVGTGGDGANTFNVSTVTAIVAAAAGVKIAKHGNRSVSSKCGSADVLEELGVRIDLSVEKNNQVLDRTGICFMFAPLYHSSMKYAGPARKQLAVRTIFNILGPLVNPAGANLQILGVYEEKLVAPLAQVLMNLGVKRAMVVCGHDGLDEITLCGSSTVCEISNGKMNSFFLNPASFGFETCAIEEIQGGDAKENAEIARKILQGERGPKRNMVILNTAATLYTAFSSKTLRECVKIAEETIDSQKAWYKLKELIQVTNNI